MHVRINRGMGLAGLALLLAPCGCSVGAGGARFLSLFGLTEEPVIVALVAQPGVVNPFMPHEELRKTMSTALKRHVRLDLCLPIQLEPNLTLGFYDFAIVPPGCYAELPGRERFDVVAVATDEEGRAARSALLVVPTGSPIDSVEVLRGRRVAFGPLDDSRTHRAALSLLREHGVKPTELQLALLPVPGSLRHYADVTDVLRSVLDGHSEAGFVDEAAYAVLPPSAEADEPAQDKLRIIARTVPVADALVIRSPRVDRETVRKVTEFLLDAGTKHPDALRPLLVSGYQKPDAELAADCARLARSAPTSAPAPGAPE